MQDETGGFQTFIPLAFHPDNTGLEPHQETVGVMDLRTMAVSRLMLDNIDHIKAYWIMLGIGTAQTALAYGADDIDGTVRHELIYHDAGAETPEILSVDDIRRLIEEAGREPIERDTLYHRVERDNAGWRTAEAWPRPDKVRSPAGEGGASARPKAGAESTVNCASVPCSRLREHAETRICWMQCRFRPRRRPSRGAAR